MKIAVFRARTETLTFASLLKSYGVRVGIINTPRRLNVSCGISVTFESAYLSVAENILKRRKFDSFAGIYDA